MKVGKSIWHAKRINDLNAEIGEYEKPTEIVTRFNYLTVMPAVSRGFMEVLKSGETLYDTWTATANSKYFRDKRPFILGQSELGGNYVFSNSKTTKKFFKAGDLMWVDGESPIESIEEKYGNGASATAEIEYVGEVNLTIAIRLKRNQSQVKQ